jgi:hypothetical protein
VGLQGQSYQVHGLSSTVYCLISSPSLQVNAECVFLSSGRCPLVDGHSAADCWSHPGSYVGAIGLMQRSADGQQLERLKVVAGPAARGFDTGWSWTAAW